MMYVCRKTKQTQTRRKGCENKRNNSFRSRKSLVKATDLDSLSCQKSFKDRKKKQKPVFVSLLKTELSKLFSVSETFKVPSTDFPLCVYS